jgi:diguanylate cyclase (GGDEF)-like protein/PAS domain S-box-containing protein
VPVDIPAAIREGRDVETDVRFRARDGHAFWVRLEIRVLRGDDGAVRGYIAIGTDISWRRRYIDALRAANERFEQITRQSRDVIWEVDADGTLLYVSAAITDVLGYEPAELVGGRLDVLFAGESTGSDVPDPLDQLSALRPGSTLEVALRARSGQLHYCLASAGPLVDREAMVNGLRGTFNDITERKLVELRLNRSEARLKRAMSGSSDGHWEVDLRTGESFVSTRFKELLGYGPTADGALSRFDPADLQKLVHPDDLQQAQSVHQAHLERGTPYDLTVRLRCHSGQFRWFRIRGATERDASGTPQFVAGVLSDVTELKLAEGELEWHALHDSLTSLANRQQFLDRLNRLQKGTRRTDRGVCAILSMDFDRFKLVNDVYGHAAGDELLCSIARRLKDSVRETDLVARFGGDEFLVLLFDAESAARVQQIAARLCSILAAPHVLSSGAEVTSTASIGVIVLEPGDSRPAELLLREADAAMYQAKAEAKGSYRFFAPELRVRMNRKALLEADLRKADFDAHFHLVYQPIVNLHTGAIAGFEALVRWRRNGEEPVSPFEFIPIAEDTALIVPIGRWITRRVCEDLKAWRAAAPAATDIAISINLSRREIVEPDYCDALTGIVHAHGLEPHDIQLELTETALVGDRFDLIPHAKRLREAGFSLSMDDFGTGQSSLNSLINLPIETLKIDKEFVRHMMENRASIAVVHSVITLALRLELRIVAEGIESAAEVATLQAMDCEFGQGFYFAAPVAAEKALAMLSEGLPGGPPGLDAPIVGNGTHANDADAAGRGGMDRPS